MTSDGQAEVLQCGPCLSQVGKDDLADVTDASVDGPMIWFHYCGRYIYQQRGSAAYRHHDLL